MSYQWRAPDNTYLQSVTGGTVATTVNKDVVSQWVNSLEPWETNILNKAMSTDEVEYETHQWGQSSRVPFTTNLNGAINNATTTVTVATGTGVFLQKYGVIMVVDYKSGSTTDLDWTTQENFWITAIAGDVLTVTTRPYGGAAASHADGAYVEFIGTSEPLNDYHQEAPRQSGFRLFNYPQRFNAQLTADKRKQNMPTWEYETGEFEARFNEEMVKQKKLLQKSIFHGKRRAGTPAVPSAMGGVDEFLTTNNIDLSGQLLTFPLIEDALYNIQLSSASANKKEIVVHTRTKQLLDTQLNPIRRATMADNVYNTQIQTYKTNFGDYTIFADDDVPPGKVYLLDWSLIKVRPFKGLNWHVSGRDGAVHGVDWDVKAISGDFTLEVAAEKSMAVLGNFITDIDQYPVGINAY